MSAPPASGGGRRLLRAVRAAAPAGPDWQRLAIVGICKNAGKTVALNHLIAAACSEQVPLALASTGRDGEDRDAITDLPKPRIWAPAGAWVATVSDVLATGSARLAVAAELDIATPLGHMVLAQVAQAGTVVLVGPGARQRLGHVLDALMSRAGPGTPPGLLLLDGSFDRSAAAAPAMTGTVVVAVGAAYSADVERTVARARHVADVMGLPPVPPEWRESARGALSAHPVALVGNGGAEHPVAVASALSDPEAVLRVLAAMNGATGGLAVAGAVTDTLLALLSRAPDLLQRWALLTPDPTHLVCSVDSWRRFRQAGGRAHVLETVRLAGIACNPHAPMGPGYDPADLLFRIREALPGTTAVDVVFES